MLDQGQRPSWVVNMGWARAHKLRIIPGLTMDKLGAKAFLVHFGLFALGIPLAFAERWGKGVNPFLGKPRWVLRSLQILFLLYAAVFVTLLALSHAASPQRRLCFEQSRKNSLHLRTRLSLPERLGITVLRLRLDCGVLHADDALVVPAPRRVDCGDA